MNRPIKFRVWHKGKNQWVHPPGIEPNILGEIILLGEFCRVPLKELDDLEVLQFTGLFDKDGQEIYEGDILASHYNIGVVVFVEEDAAFEAVFKEDYLEGTRQGELMVCGENFFACKSKILGNIFENPELLERNSP